MKRAKPPSSSPADAAPDRPPLSALRALVAPAKRPRKRVGRLVCAPHLAWIRSLSCLVPGCRVRGCDPHHVREGTGGGTGLKPGDDKAVPLCHEHHMELHDRGRRTFAARHRLDLVEQAARLWAASEKDGRDASIGP
jgi:hypothetical protein